MTGLIAKYPDFWAGSAEFVDLQTSMEPEIAALRERQADVMLQLDIATATWGLRYWEEALGIAVETGKELEYRRSRVKSKLRGAGVVTVGLIDSVAESYSNGEVEVTEYPAEYRLEIKFVGTVGIPPNMEDLTVALQEIMPAHLQWDYIIVYNTWDMVKPYTWAELASRTWAGLKESDLNG